MSPMRDGQTNERRTREDRATHPNGSWMAEFRNDVVDGGVTSQLIRFVAKYNAGSPDKTEDEGHISRSISLQILQSLISKF